MFFELIAAIAAGGLGAGAVMIVNKLTRGALPKWAMPAAAGASMIGFGIYMEYSWFERTTDEFPEGVEVVLTHEAGGFWRPWTYVWPLVDRFVAVDHASIRRHEAAPEQRMANLLFFGRWQAARVAAVIYDCAQPAMAPLLDTVEFDDRGVVSKAPWGPVEAGDPAMEIVCKE